jgi:uncharacterized membrane protein YsdA (DUF1294 family)
MKNINLYIAIYMIVINAYAVIIMYIDKRKAKRHEWRIPEARLFGTAALFGSAGILLGMYLFRHKTKHWKFVVFVPVLLLVNIYLLYKLFQLGMLR